MDSVVDPIFVLVGTLLFVGFSGREMRGTLNLTSMAILACALESSISNKYNFLSYVQSLYVSILALRKRR